MRKQFVIAALAVATTLAPAAAFAQASTATGAVGGAVVGAVIGAGVGSTVGLAAEPPQEVVTYVQRDTAPSVVYKERVVVGQPLAESVELRSVPQHTEYRYAVVNDQRVIVEPKTRKVIKIIQYRLVARTEKAPHCGAFFVARRAANYAARSSFDFTVASASSR